MPPPPPPTLASGARSPRPPASLVAQGRAARVRGETAHLSAAELMIVNRWERLTSALLSLETGKVSAGELEPLAKQTGRRLLRPL